MSEVKFQTIAEFQEFLEDTSRKFNRYYYISPTYEKRKKPRDYKHFWLFMNGAEHMFVIKENTEIRAMKELAQFIADFIDGLYPESKTAFKIERDASGQKLVPDALRKIEGLEIYWKGKATDDTNYFPKPGNTQ